MLRSCRNTAKQPETVFATCVRIVNQSINQSTFVKRHKSRANRRRTDFYVECTEEEPAGIASWLSVFLCRVDQSVWSSQNLGKYPDHGLHALERLRQSQLPANSVEFGADAGLMSTK